MNIHILLFQQSIFSHQKSITYCLEMKCLKMCCLPALKAKIRLHKSQRLQSCFHESDNIRGLKLNDVQNIIDGNSIGIFELLQSGLVRHSHTSHIQHKCVFVSSYSQSVSIFQNSKVLVKSQINSLFICKLFQ